MKPTRQFVICLMAFLFLSLSSLTCYANKVEDIPFSSPDTSNQPGNQRAPLRIPLTADLTADALSFIFLYPVGNATITITDEYGAEVYIETIDTFTQSNLYIPVDQWNGGIYHISIEYGCNTLTAEFEL